MIGAPSETNNEWSDEALPIRTANSAYPLPGYARRLVGKVGVVAHESLLDSVAAIIEKHGTLYAWAEQQPQPRALRGRAPVYVATVPNTEIALVVRHAWHGGFFAPFTRDLFLRPTRAPIELVRTVTLRHLGIAVPELLAYALYPAGPGLNRVDVASRLLPDAFDLGAVLAEHAPDISRTDAIQAVEALLVQLAECGIVHPDLNVKNILLTRTKNGATATVIDVDVVRWVPNQRPSVTMIANVARLTRSIKKWRRQFGIVMPDAELNALVARFIAAAPTTLADRASNAKDVPQQSPGFIE